MVEMIVPRFWGIIISSFFLLSLGLLMSILGGALMGQLFAGVSLEEYLRHIPTIVTLPSIFGGLVKCLVFATILATLCTYFGYNTTGGAKGVGRSVIKTSVMTMVSIVIADWATSFLQTSILEIIRGLG
jgi:phospholipid/cholesterol/gamma-HCH transport system permease protein